MEGGGGRFPLFFLFYFVNGIVVAECGGQWSLEFASVFVAFCIWKLNFVWDSDDEFNEFCWDLFVFALFACCGPFSSWENMVAAVVLVF